MSRVKLDAMLLESFHWLNLKQENFGAEQLRVPTDAVKVSDRVVATCLTWNEFKVKQPSLCLCVRHWHTDEMKTCLHTSGKHPGGWGSPALFLFFSLTLSIWSHYPWQYALRVYCRCVALLSRHCKSLNKQKMNCSVIAQPGHMELFVNSRLFTFQKVFFYLLSAAVLHNTISSANRRDVNCLAFSRRKVDFWKIALDI